jgi:hypothetical protein
MEYVVEGTPQRLLPQAETFMASEGYSIDSRSDTSVTFSRMPPMASYGGRHKGTDVR